MAHALHRLHTGPCQRPAVSAPQLSHSHCPPRVKVAAVPCLVLHPIARTLTRAQAAYDDDPNSEEPPSTSQAASQPQPASKKRRASKDRKSRSKPPAPPPQSTPATAQEPDWLDDDPNAEPQQGQPQPAASTQAEPGSGPGRPGARKGADRGVAEEEDWNIQSAAVTDEDESDEDEYVEEDDSEFEYGPLMLKDDDPL